MNTKQIDKFINKVYQSRAHHVSTPHVILPVNKREKRTKIRLLDLEEDL